MDLFDTMARYGAQSLQLVEDEARGLRALIAIHSTRRGPAFGGIRTLSYTSFNAAVTDALRLAQHMSYKAALADLPAGGGKAVVIKTPNMDRTLAAEPGYSNVKVVNLDPAVALPEQVDVVWTSLNYHDMHNRPADYIAAINKAALNALKPGGVYVVIDHAAEKGSGARDTQKFHRIDEDLVKTEVLAAGFEAAGDSAVLRHADDKHDKSSHEVERGKTDQFVLLFRKPRK